MKKLLKIVVILLILAGLGAGGFWGYRKYLNKPTVIQYRTEEVARMDISSTISATGTVEPEELVNVGAQVSGKIVSFGTDSEGKEVDYGSIVKEGSVLALIDDALYDAEARSARAQKLQAEATILSAEANIKQARAQHLLAKSNWERASDLYPKGSVAKSEYDSAQAEYLTSQADIAVSEAALEQAKASKAIAEAALDKATRNLEYCVISCPVDGVIIDRRVSIGQTVVSNMSASSLFLIAKDLKRMQVWVSVNEADIGNIHPGMAVTFTVDAFPDESFEGEVHKIRYNATMSQNVVTYVVEVSTDNSNGRLLPYLTASVKFIRDSRKNVLTVPNAALRYMPESAPEIQTEPGERVVWVRSGNTIAPVKIVTGLNDGIVTEVVSGDLKEGMEVVTGSSVVVVEDSDADAASGGSPFLPKPPQRRRR